VLWEEICVQYETMRGLSVADREAASFLTPSPLDYSMLVIFHWTTTYGFRSHG